MSGVGTAAIDQQLARAKRLIASGSYSAAEKLLRLILAASPGDARAWHELGTARYRSGNYAGAVEAFQRRLAIEVDNPIANYSLGAALAEMGRGDEARRYLERALELKPDFPQARQRLARLGAGAGPPKPNPQPVSVGPGDLLVEGRSGLGAYLGRLVLAAVLAGLGLRASMSEPPDSDAVARSLPIISALHDRLVFMQQYFPNSPQTTATAQQYEAVVGFLGVVLAIAPLGIMAVAVFIAVHAVAASLLTRYRIYQRRIDIDRGVLKRVVDSVWLYEVTDIAYQQPLSLLLTGTAQLVVKTERQPRPYRITGLASASEMRRLWEMLRDASFAQRREIKGVWV